MNLLTAAVCAVLISAPVWAQTRATADLKNAQGQEVGTAVITPDGQGIKIALRLHDLPPGEHAIHIHETAKCDAPDFKSAGGHLNPGHKHHGKDNPEGAHAGDMDNITLPESGKLNTTITQPNVTLGGGPNSLFEGDGTALVIHADKDDYKSDPAGNAGARLACGVIVPQ